ncbi:MAG: hypothetical protein ACK5CP_07540, partial [Bacteroidota bacterium]
MSETTPAILWEATAAEKQSAEITRYLQWLKESHQLCFSSYDELYQWSIEKPADFWRSLVAFYQLFSFPPDHP